MQFKEEADLLNWGWRWGLSYENIKDFWENLIFTSLDFWFPVIFILSQGKATVTRQEWRYYRPFRGSEAVWCPPLAAPVAPGLAQNATHRGPARVLRLDDYCYFFLGQLYCKHTFFSSGRTLSPPNLWTEGTQQAVKIYFALNRWKGESENLGLPGEGKARQCLQRERKLWHAPLNKREQVVFTGRTASY